MDDGLFSQVLGLLRREIRIDVDIDVEVGRRLRLRASFVLLPALTVVLFSRPLRLLLGARHFNSELFAVLFHYLLVDLISKLSTVYELR